MTYLKESGVAIAPQVERTIKSENIALEELDAMVKKAAITTHEFGNRRFHNWIFDIKQGKVWKMVQDREVPVRIVQSSMSLTAHEDCPDCEGDGCKECAYTGEVVVHYVVENKPKR